MNKLHTFNKVLEFAEKPNLEKAEQFLASGQYLWNAGIFVWSANSFLVALKKFEPTIFDIFQNGNSKYYTLDEQNFVKEAYNITPSVSIDYAIMEKADNIYVLSTEFGWSDLGTWKSLYETCNADDNRNVIQGEAMVFDTQNSIIKVSDGKLAIVEGLDNFIVAFNDDVVMICPKEKEQQVKTYVSLLKEKNLNNFS